MSFLGDWLSSRRARYQADALKYQAETRLHERRAELAGKREKAPADLMEMRLLESAGGSQLMGWGDMAGLWTDYLSQSLDFARGGLGAGAGLTNRTNRHGGDWPFITSEAHLASHRDFSRLVAPNPNIQGLLGGRRRYTIGTGATVRAVAKDDSGPAKDAAVKAQKFLDHFGRANRFPFRLRSYYDRASIDGEGIWRLFPREDGPTDLRTVYSEQIKCPPGEDAEYYSYGICTDPEDAETYLEYAVFPLQGDTQKYDPVPPEEIVFYGRNRPDAVKRSLPDWTLSTGEICELADDLANNMGTGSVIQAAIAYIRQHIAGMPASTIRDFATTDASYQRTDPYTGRQVPVKKFAPGTIVDTDKNTEFLASPYNAGIEAHASVFQLLMNRVSARWNAPKWLATSNNDEVNYASSLTAESPFVIATLEDQEYLSEPVRTVHERVLAIGAAAGRLPRNILDLVEVKVTLPSPVARDRAAEATARTAEIADGYLSPQEACEEAGREWEKTRKDFEAAKAQGWTPPGNAGTPKPGEPGGEPGGGPKPPEPKPAPKPVAESLLEADSGGRWITIGGAKGGDGKRHGGSPVYIEGGRITKGHPSLVGKKPGEIGGDAEHGSHRKQLSQSKGYEHARRHKEARQAGIDPAHLDSLAGEIKAHHDAFAGERKDLLKSAREHSAKNGFGDIRNLTMRHSRENLDAASLKGFDQVAEATQKAYPHHFHEETGEHGSHADQLFDMLTAGDPHPMSHDDAYAQAFDHLHAARGHTPAHHDDFIPESLAESFDEGKHPRDDAGEFVSTGKMRAAAVDPKKAAELRAKVTNPAERAKLDAAIQRHAPAPRYADKPTTRFHSEEARRKFYDAAGAIRHVVNQYGHTDSEEFKAELGTATKKYADRLRAHYGDAYRQAEAQLRADFGDAADEHLPAVRAAFKNASIWAKESVENLAHYAARMNDPKLPDYERRDARHTFNDWMVDDADKFTDQQNKIWDAIEKAKTDLDAKHGRKGPLGRYFESLDEPGGEPGAVLEADDPAPAKVADPPPAEPAPAEPAGPSLVEEVRDAVADVVAGELDRLQAQLGRPRVTRTVIERDGEGRVTGTTQTEEPPAAE